ncbi:MAG: MFS transporter [Candidatus Nitrosocosmicus sp.]
MTFFSSLRLNWLSTDGKLILLARAIRTFAYGFLSIVLAIYLKLIGFNDALIGIILTSTLINSVIFTLLATIYADKIGRKKILIAYAGLMSISGIIFFVSNNYILLIISALVGTINVTGSETGSFLSLEQAILPQTIKELKKRNTMYGIYNMIGTFAMSAGVLLSGLPNVIQYYYHLNNVQSIQPLFLIYAILGFVVFLIYLNLSSKIEIETLQNKIDKKKQKMKTNTTTSTTIKIETKSMTKTLSPKSKEIITKLSGLFAIDSFAGGFVIQSIVSLWFFTRFNVDLTILSYIFSIAGVLTAFSFIISTKIADRIGLINTMVFTHLPSNLLLILVAFSPSFHLALVLYLARMGLSQMDVPTRQSYIVAVVNEDERTTAAGFTNISRNVAQAISPSIAGYILQSASFLAAPFLFGGLLKIVYDILIYANFKKIKPPEEQKK